MITRWISISAITFLLAMPSIAVAADMGDATQDRNKPMNTMMVALLWENLTPAQQSNVLEAYRKKNNLTMEAWNRLSPTEQKENVDKAREWWNTLPMGQKNAATLPQEERMSSEDEKMEGW